ncbi:MAG: 2-hydroxyhepta-2,4-diene-1,7-dioate isomerase [Flavobacteriaceae bacterium]|nr:MAG: 2-hydroxyhepta-2,4-diene-1,7-dioate isomerase [Flavobacteriaceae bacterium]
MKIICIGKNYKLHALEFDGIIPDEPLIFMKPDSAVLRKGIPFVIPEFTNDVHYETEVVLKVCKVGKHIQKEFAHRYYEEFALGLDLTARDLQYKLKDMGYPWEKAKAFDGSAFVSDFFPKEGVDLDNLNFSLTVNDKFAQKGNTKDMSITMDEIICYVSKYFTLKKGDLIFTGSPEGVATIHSGDVLKGFIGEKHVFQVNVK